MGKKDPRGGGHRRLKSACIALVALAYAGLVALVYASGLVSPGAVQPVFFLLFPLGVAVSIVAMSSGISGSNFWVPINVMVLHIEPRAGFWLALFTMLFGFGSGMIRHFWQKTLRPKLVARYLMMAAPGAVAGTLLLPHVKTSLLLIAFGVFVCLYGLRMLFLKKQLLGSSERVTLVVAFIGGMLKGMIATGLGKMLLSRLICKQGVSHPEAVGTVVGVVFFTNVAAVSSILCQNAVYSSLLQDWERLFSIMVFVAPAVVIGGQIGPRIPGNISRELLMKYVGSLLIFISYFMIMRGIASF